MGERRKEGTKKNWVKEVKKMEEKRGGGEIGVDKRKKKGNVVGKKKGMSKKEGRM